MDWTLVALGGFLIVVAFFGCIVPCVPGPLLGWCALLALAFSRFAIPTAWLVAAGAVMAVVTVLDYIVPDVVHVLYKGRIVKTEGRELVAELEEKGYDWIKREQGDL